MERVAAIISSKIEIQEEIEITVSEITLRLRHAGIVVSLIRDESCVDLRADFELNQHLTFEHDEMFLIYVSRSLISIIVNVTWFSFYYCMVKPEIMERLFDIIEVLDGDRVLFLKSSDGFYYEYILPNDFIGNVDNLIGKAMDDGNTLIDYNELNEQHGDMVLIW